MAVFVDSLIVGIPSQRWPFRYHCHLVADTPDELHVFAAKLGLKRHWYQHTTVPHYDLTEGKRKLAVRFGAIELSRRAMRDFISKYRIVKGKNSGTGNKKAV